MSIILNFYIFRYKSGGRIFLWYRDNLSFSLKTLFSLQQKKLELESGEIVVRGNNMISTVIPKNRLL